MFRHGIQRSARIGALVALLAAVACSEDSTGVPDPALSNDDVGALADEVQAVLDGIVVGQLAAMTDEVGGPIAASDGIGAEGAATLVAAMDEVVTEFEFTRTGPCRAGGQVTATGSGVRTADRDTHTVHTTVGGTKTLEACARERGDVVITIDGSGTFESERLRVDGAFSGLQTTDSSGAFSYSTSDGREGACDYSLSWVLDPDAGTIHVTGTVCDREVDRTREIG